VAEALWASSSNPVAPRRLGCSFMRSAGGTLRRGIASSDLFPSPSVRSRNLTAGHLTIT
jgi:hypothetical protein